MKRARSEGDVYHVVVRGVGRQIIFEEDGDRHYFKKALADQGKAYGVEIWAWCLMDNHVHLLVHGEIERVSGFMRHVELGYAKYFNKKYDRVGSLFQGRFVSVPISDDEQLVAAVRYIHLNPVKAGGPLDGPWSSYAEYVGKPLLAKTAFVMDVFGGKKQFEAAHCNGEGAVPTVRLPRLSESEAAAVMTHVLDGINPYDVRSLPKEERNAILKQLKAQGLSIRQIERATSIGRSIIARA